jgi:erythromycin esterase-like protein
MTDPELVREIAQALSGDANDYDKLLELIGNARFVLLGEATHGTHEFYSERAAITKRLIAEKGFSILAIEADWPDSARVHRYVRGAATDANADQALSGFRRFPMWMWRNMVVVELVEWLRGFNKNIDPKRAPVGFYGMDLYNLHASIEAVLNTSTKLIRTLRDARVCVTPVSIILAASRRSTAMPRRSAQSNPVRTRPLNSWSSCSKRRPNF